MAEATFIEYPHPGRERGRKIISERYDGPPGFDHVVAWLLEQKEKYHDVEVEYEDLTVSREVPFTEEEGRLVEARAAYLSTPLRIGDQVRGSWQDFLYDYYDKKGWPYPHPNDIFGLHL